MTKNSTLKEIVEEEFGKFESVVGVIQEVSCFPYEVNISDEIYLPNFSESDALSLGGRVTGELILNSFKSIFGIRELIQIMRLVYDGKLPAVCPGIRVSLETNSDNYIITVCDNGQGILPENLYRIWERGFSTFGTSGIGLASMKNEVETRFNGRIGVHSEPDKETRFSVYIPLGYRSEWIRLHSFKNFYSLT